MKEEAERIVDRFEWALTMADWKIKRGDAAILMAEIHVEEMIKLFESVFITEGSLMYQYLIDLKNEIKKV